MIEPTTPATANSLLNSADCDGPNSASSTRTVVFVGGTSYSGSTLLDMILANDPTGLSCGEVYAIFYPYRRHHLHLDGLSRTVDWRAIKASGPQNLYRNLFERFPKTRFIIDSSKSPIWISERSSELQKMGIRTENLLIWKSPSEFLASRRKRGQERGWQREWVNYHRYYFTLVENWKSVRYSDLVANKATLPRVCAMLGIPYFPTKEHYWNQEQHTVFGNDTARIHLHEESSPEFARVRDSIASTIDRYDAVPHRMISTNAQEDAAPEYFGNMFRQITEMLERRDVLNPTSVQTNDPYPIGPRRASRFYHGYQIAKLKYGLKWILDLFGR
jgi:hypothetical protein